MKILEAFSDKKIDQITSAKTVGIDIGSRSAKGVLIANGEVYTAIIPTGFYMEETAQKLFDILFEQSGLTLGDIDYVVGTGYGRIALKLKEVPVQIVTEISCHGLGADFLGDDIHTIIDIGGQDSKAIKINPENGKVLNFVMNDKCAAGTGRFLEKMANVLGYDVDKIGEVALDAVKPTDISSQCVVFAESEVISERAKGENVADLAMGINVSVAKRVNNLLNRVGIEEGILFTGGVSNNVGMRKALEKIMNVKISTAKIDTVFAGAIGAAIYGQKYVEAGINIAHEENKHTRLDLTKFINSIEKKKEEYIKRSAGQNKNVAYICAYTPIEILAAANVAHIRLFHAGTPNEISSGEKITQSVFCDLTKSLIGKFSENDPLYSAIDKVYTFYTCDCMKKTAEAIGNNFVPTTIFNLPRIRDRKNSADYFREEIIAFKKDVEKLTGEKIEEEKIREQIKLYNRVKQLYREISSYRKVSTPVITSKEFQELAKGYYYLPAEELISLLEEVLEQIKKIKPIEEKAVRLLVAGGVIAEGDDGLTQIVEEKLGAYIVVEDNCTGYKPFIHDIPESGDVYDAIVKGYLGKAPCIRMKPLVENEQLAAELAKEYEVDGVIFYYLKFCPGYAIAKNQFNQRFQKMNIPVLEIPNDYSKNDEGQLLTRIEAFVEVIKERRNDNGNN